MLWTDLLYEQVVLLYFWAVVGSRVLLGHLPNAPSGSLLERYEGLIRGPFVYMHWNLFIEARYVPVVPVVPTEATRLFGHCASNRDRSDR